MTSSYVPDPDQYSIYKVPDTEGSLTKIVVMTAYGTITGTVFALYDIVGYTKPSTLLGAFMRFNHWVVPFASIGATYAVTTSMVASIRKKDDQYNHFWGGFIAASILGAKYKNMAVGFNMGILFGVTSMFLKRAYMENWPLRSPANTRKNFGSFHHYDRGYGTTRPDPQGDPNI